MSNRQRNTFPSVAGHLHRGAEKVGGAFYRDDGTIDNGMNWRLPKITWVRNLFTEIFATMLLTVIYLLPIETGSTVTGHALGRAFGFMGLLFSMAFWNLKNWHMEDVCHMNPLLTLAYCFLSKTSWLQGLIYILISQPAGSALGALIVYAFSFQGGNFGTVSVGVPFTNDQAFGYEVFGTFVYIFIAGALMWGYHFGKDLQARYPDCYGGLCCWLPSIPIGVAGIIAALTNMGYNISGALFNPYFYLWPAIYSGKISGIGSYVSIAGPVVGGFLAAVILYLACWAIERNYRDLCNPCVRESERQYEVPSGYVPNNPPGTSFYST